MAALLVDAYRSWAKLGLNPKAASYAATDVVADLAYKEVWLLEKAATSRPRDEVRRPGPATAGSTDVRETMERWHG
jgi:hypothetical protein